VVSNLFEDGSSSAAVRRPLYSISFGDGGADVWAQAVVSVVVETGLTPFADVVTLFLAGGASAPGVALGDSGTVELGYEDAATEMVFTGQVEEVQRSVQGTIRVTATNGGASLSRLRVNQSYELQTAGDIVKDLAGRVGVDTESVEDGADFPFYVVDDRRSAYRHVAALACKSGYLAYFTPEGKLSFAPFTAGQAVQTFTYGEDVLSLRATEAPLVVGAVTIVGEGAAGNQGQEAWSWLVKDPSSVTGSAGSGDPERPIQDASLRSAEAAQGAAEGIADAAEGGRLIGELLVPGSPAVVVGSAVEISNGLQEALNGLFLVRRVRHRFSKRGGFATWVHFGSTGDGGPGGLL
jgi:phage protein D